MHSLDFTIYVLTQIRSAILLDPELNLYAIYMQLPIGHNATLGFCDRSTFSTLATIRLQKRSAPPFERLHDINAQS